MATSALHYLQAWLFNCDWLSGNLLLLWFCIVLIIFEQTNLLSCVGPETEEKYNASTAHHDAEVVNIEWQIGFVGVLKII